MTAVRALPWPAQASLAFVAVTITCFICDAVTAEIRDLASRRRHR